jgi:hypothetical protein
MMGLRYPVGALLADYLRAATGMGFTGTPLLFIDPASWAGYVLAGLFALFLCYGIRTALRQATRVDVTETGIRTAGPRPKHVRWDAVREVSLKYYATRRDGQGGWMQLRVADTRAAVRMESSLERFPAVVERAVEAGRAAGLTPDLATSENLRSMGIRWDAATA